MFWPWCLCLFTPFVALWGLEMSAPFIVGVTFKDTDLDKREALTLPLAEMPQHLENFVSDSALAECIILCTCNRIEFYAVPADDVDVDEATQAVRRL